MRLADYEIDGDVSELLLQYGDHLGLPRLRELVAADGDAARARRRDRHGGGRRRPVRDRDRAAGRGRPRADRRARTTRPTSRRRGRLAPTSSCSSCASRRAGRSTPSGSSPCCGPRRRLVSLTYPHNPTGAMIGRDGSSALVAIVERPRRGPPAGRRDLPRARLRRPAADRGRRCRSARSASRRCRRPTACPGLRIGWIACRDRELAETLLAAKEQILICGSAIDEEMAARVLEARPRILPADPRARSARHLASSATGWRRQDIFEWVEPQRRRRLHAALSRRGRGRRRPLLRSPARRARHLRRARATGSTRTAARSALGFAWPETDELERGLAGLLAAAKT